MYLYTHLFIGVGSADLAQHLIVKRLLLVSAAWITWSRNHESLGPPRSKEARQGWHA